MSSDGGRRGGREARRQLRAAPLAEALRPVRAGLRRWPLPTAERSRHPHHPRRCARRARATWAWRRRCPPASRPAPRAAAFVNGHGRLSFPRALVEDVIAGAPGASPCWPGSAPRPGALGQQGSLRHGRRRRAHGRPQDPGISRVAAAGPLRRRPHRRRARPHPFLPARPGPARHVGRDRAGPQHALRLHRRHDQACRHQLLPWRAR